MKHYLPAQSRQDFRAASVGHARALPRLLWRRTMLRESAGGLAGIAFSWLLSQQAPASIPAGQASFDLRPKAPHVVPKAQRVIYIFMGGGPSQIDLFDPKPMLAKYDGQPIPLEINQRAIGASNKLMASPFKFQQHGRSGIELSELLPHLAEVVDDIAVVRSGVTTRTDHGEALLLLHTGRPISGFPSIGCWVSYALGSDNDSLPAYIAMPDSDPEWTRHATTAGWLPALYQAAPFNVSGSPLFDLQRPAFMTAAEQRSYLDLTQALNRRHQQTRQELTELDARIQNFELAARMQVTALQQVDLSNETAATQRLYGLENDTTKKFGAQCLTARRLIESGVRFVHLIRNDWDHHGKLKKDRKSVV